MIKKFKDPDRINSLIRFLNDGIDEKNKDPFIRILDWSSKTKVLSSAFGYDIKNNTYFYNPFHHRPIIESDQKDLGDIILWLLAVPIKSWLVLFKSGDIKK